MSITRAAWLTLATLLVGTLAPAAPAAPAASPEVEVSVSVVADRLTYIDGTHRTGSSPRFVELGFGARRWTGVVTADAPEAHTPYLISTGEGPDQIQAVSVDLTHRGDLEVVMSPGPHPAYPHAVRGTASGDGNVRGGVARWVVPDAEPGPHTFSVHFRGRFADPTVGSYLPESRITFRSGSEQRTLVFKHHVAPIYGSPDIDPGKVYEPIHAPETRDEWVAQPIYSAMGAHHWTTGKIFKTRDHLISYLAPGSGGALNSGSMGTAYAGDAKAVGFFDFLFRPGYEIGGFRIGAQTTDIFGPIFPFTTNPQGGRIYDGDGGTLAISMSAGSAHWKKKAEPRNNDGTLLWDWDGRWAEGWSTADSFRAPGIRGTSDPIYTNETALYPGSYGGDIDNRKGDRPVRGPRWYMDLPDFSLGFVGWGGAAPPDSKFRTTGGFTSDGRFVLRPVIGPGGYLLEAETDGYLRRWQPSLSIGGHFFGARPEDVDEGEGPVVRRVFAFPPRSVGHIGIATTTGLSRYFKVRPGVWEVVATFDGVDLRLIEPRLPAPAGAPRALPFL